MPYKPTIRYNLQLVELFEGQGPFDAFQSNYLFYKSDNLRLNTFQYPVSAPTLNDCKSYAWRVVGNYDNDQSDYSIRIFNTVCDSLVENDDQDENKPTASNVYYKLKRSLDESFYTVSGNFKIIIDNKYSLIEKITYSLFDNDHTNIAASNTLVNDKSNDESLHVGENIFIVNIDKLGLLPEEYYVLEVDGLKRKYYLKIKYITEE